jgi:hypothetical protein
LLAALAALATVASAPALASDDSIATDRPDFVESSAVVGTGRLQVESSVAVDRNRHGGVRESVWSTPTLVRIGIGETLELRVESDGPMRQRSRAPGGAASTERGYADASLGVKWHARDAEGAMPSMALLLHADLSSGSAAFREEGTRPSARVVAEWELSDEMSFGVMPGVGYEKANGGGAFGILGVVLGKAWNARLRSFVEVSSPHIARAAHGGSEAVLTAGSAYLISRNMQVDAAISRGLNAFTPDLSLTLGLSFKL